MAYKFNGGNGAVVCDYCGVIFCTDLSPEKYKMLRRIYGLSSEKDPDLCPNIKSCKDNDDVPRELVTQLRWSPYE